jgi:hypothetical protein
MRMSGRSRPKERSLLHDVLMPLPSRRIRSAGAVAGLLLLLPGCSGGSDSISSGDIERDARVVLRAGLQPGSTGETAAQLVHKYFDLEGVAGTHGDAGRHVWVYTTPDATSAEISAVLSAIRTEPSVVRVEKER